MHIELTDQYVDHTFVKQNFITERMASKGHSSTIVTEW